ncbi:MAG TPA: molybdopterin-binding protein [Blastocatellia bacterium]|nr:molybdopterin-binding protein [Blastocatellia bacterium]
MANIEVIIVGSEILLGMTDDTNSGYLCRALRSLGGSVRRAATVPDDVEAISREVNDSLHRGADLIFTCGGLGPTDNDVTLAAVAKAVGVSLIESEAARRFIEQRYRDLAAAGHVSSAEMTDARLKMARLPDGARIVANPVGAAPATVLEVSGARIVSLPGVPAELRAIVEGPLREVIPEVIGRGYYRERELAIDCNDESVLAPPLAEASRAHPGVYIKSRPRGFGRGVQFHIRVSAVAATGEEAETMIDGASADLARGLRDLGTRVEELEP